MINQIDKDLKVTDHGDGTRTILVMATGAGNLLGPDGKAVLRWRNSDAINASTVLRLTFSRAAIASLVKPRARRGEVRPSLVP